MGRWEFTLPDIGEGVAEGEIVGWLIRPGETVKEDQPMVEVMTDKATVTLSAPKAGRVVETRGRVGEIVKVHTVIAVFDPIGAPSVSPPATATAVSGSRPSTGSPSSASSPPGANGAPRPDEGRSATAVGDIKESLPGMSVPATAGMTVDANDADASKPLATPATRKLARDMNVDLRRVPPTGPQGRVTRTDVESFARSASLPPPTIRQAPPSPPPAVGLSVPAPADVTGPSERVPLAGLRRLTAQKMARSKATAAHFTFVEECDVTSLKALRARLIAPAEAHGVKLTYLPFIVKAAALALEKHPVLNTTLDDATSEIVYRKEHHIGVAIATEAGLLVPVVKDVDHKSLLDIARDIQRLATDARAGKLAREDLQGSTFTITSLGAQAGLLATPIINYPEVAILGVHRMKQRPVVKDGQIVIGDVMLLSLSFDHRIVDGHVGAAFAYEVIGYLEQPERLLLEMA